MVLSKFADQTGAIELNGRLAGAQIHGAREYQEDSFGVLVCAHANQEFEHTLLVIADGMGGHAAGDVASEIVVRLFLEAYQDGDGVVSERLRDGLFIANGELAHRIAEDAEYEGMGCTLAAAVISRNGLEWISVGDSPLFLFRNGSLRRLNADHSMASVLAELVESGQITEDEVAEKGDPHGLRSVLMGTEIHLIDQSSQPLYLDAGDFVILASDGLLVLGDSELAESMYHSKQLKPEEVLQRLFADVESIDDRNQDNTTIIVFKPEKSVGKEP